MANATAIEQLARFFDVPQPRATFEDPEIDGIASLLEQCGHAASKCPRTYILFRTIGHLDMVDKMMAVGFTDQLFPVDIRRLPSFLEPRVKSAIVQQQGLILTKSLDLENGRHRHFAPTEPLPFNILNVLGKGGQGQVDRVQSKISFQYYALKRFRRKAAFGNRSSQEAVKEFANEMKIMRSLKHSHIVSYIGSYTDRSYLGLLMSPVADIDLAGYNDRLCGYLQAAKTDNIPSAALLQHQIVTTEMASNLRTYYGCLAAALVYLHDQSVRHKDIKPQNILIHRGNVLLADFGISRDFADDLASTTSGATLASPRYCAPEVAAYEPRNTSSDIWSLGCVFLEMAGALQGFDVKWIKQYFIEHGSNTPHFHNNPGAIAELLHTFKSSKESKTRASTSWIETMLSPQRTARPTATRVLEIITCPGPDESISSGGAFCGICCVPDWNSDSVDSLVDDFEMDVAPVEQVADSITGGDGHTNSSNINAFTDRASKLSVATFADEVTSSLDMISEIVVVKPVADFLPSRAEILQAKTEGIIDTKDGENNTPELMTSKHPHRLPTSTMAQTSSERHNQLDRHAIDRPTRYPPNEDERAPRRTSEQAANDVSTGATAPATVSTSSEVAEIKRISWANYLTPVTHRRTKVFGTSLSTSIEFASMQLHLRDLTDGSLLKGPVPIVVVRCGESIKEHASSFVRLVANDCFHTSRISDVDLASAPFDTSPEFGCHIRWSSSELELCEKVLFRYLECLPDPLITANIARDMKRAWNVQYDQLVLKYRSFISGLPLPNLLVVLYMLDLFAVCVKCANASADRIGRQLSERYYRCFFGRQSAPGKFGTEDKNISISMLTLMIREATNILTSRVVEASTEDMANYLYSSFSNASTTLKTDLPDLRVHEMTSRTSLHAENNNSGPDANIDLGVTPYDILAYELLCDGVTPFQIKKHETLIRFIAFEPEHHCEVFGMPLYLSNRYAVVERSISKDFDSSVDKILKVPPVVAACCTYLIKKNQLTIKIFGDATAEGQEHANVSMFNLFPEYGKEIDFEGWSHTQVGSTLLLYLFSLPEPLITVDVAPKILAVVRSPLPRWKDIIQLLQQIPNPNLHALWYVLSFCAAFCAKSPERTTLKSLAVLLHSAILPSSEDYDADERLIRLLIRKKDIIMYAEFDSGPEKPVSTTRKGLLWLYEAATGPIASGKFSNKIEFVRARRNHRSGLEGELLFDVGDRIQLIWMSDNVNELWTGELDGHVGNFPGYKVDLPKGMRRPDNIFYKQSASPPVAERRSGLREKFRRMLE